MSNIVPQFSPVIGAVKDPSSYVINIEPSRPSMPARPDNVQATPEQKRDIAFRPPGDYGAIRPPCLTIEDDGKADTNTVLYLPKPVTKSAQLHIPFYLGCPVPPVSNLQRPSLGKTDKKIVTLMEEDTSLDDIYTAFQDKLKYYKRGDTNIPIYNGKPEPEPSGIIKSVKADIKVPTLCNEYKKAKDALTCEHNAIRDKCETIKQLATEFNILYSNVVKIQPFNMINADEELSAIVSSTGLDIYHNDAAYHARLNHLKDLRTSIVSEVQEHINNAIVLKKQLCDLAIELANLQPNTTGFVDSHLVYKLDDDGFDVFLESD